jgi:hypothetical protein
VLSARLVLSAGTPATRSEISLTSERIFRLIRPGESTTGVKAS